MSQDKCIEWVSRALDAALMRQTAITYNIANASTPGYQSIQVNFEEQLTAASIEDAHPFYELSGLHSSIDEQMALSVKNATQFRALIKGLNHRLAIMKLAVQGNNAS